jgi:hypothetical protein
MISRTSRADTKTIVESREKYLREVIKDTTRSDKTPKI